MKKSCLILLLIMLLVGFLFADTNVYEKMDLNTKKVIQEVDKLIEERKYETAFGTLTTANENEYILAKKIELCTNYFVQSMMHQLFAFKNLVDNEDIYDVRN